MKYILITKLENGESTEKTYSSIRKIAQELGTTYCSCYSNFLDSVEPTRKPSKKLSQVIFNKKYKIQVANKSLSSSSNSISPVFKETSESESDSTIAFST